jgi:hypothetical protein
VPPKTAVSKSFSVISRLFLSEDPKKIKFLLRKQGKKSLFRIANISEKTLCVNRKQAGMKLWTFDFFSMVIQIFIGAIGSWGERFWQVRYRQRRKHGLFY